MLLKQPRRSLQPLQPAECSNLPNSVQNSAIQSNPALSDFDTCLDLVDSFVEFLGMCDDSERFIVG